MRLRTIFPISTVAGFFTTALLVGALGLLSACAGAGGKEVSNFNQLDLAPGDTGNCESAPCQVYLQMPDGSGSYEVIANQVKLGVFPAGQKANLGGFWESTVFEIQGVDAPKTYIYVNSNQ